MQSILLSMMDVIDKKIIELIQFDASLTAREIAEKVGLTTAPCWRRIQRLEAEGIIAARVAIIDPEKINLPVLALVEIRTNRHNAEWLTDFISAIKKFPEIIEAYRTSGEVDYMLRVVAPNMETYDLFYKKLVEEVDLYDVRTHFVMERIKATTELPLEYC